MHRCLADRPYLGCAMLIGACQQAGIKTTLIQGQTRWLKNMFLDDSDELWDLITDLGKADYEHISIEPFQQHILERGKAEFQRELVDLYELTVANKNPRGYFNAHLIEQLGVRANTFLTVYRHYVQHRNHKKLRMVERYVNEIRGSEPAYVGFSLYGRPHSHRSVISRAIRESLRKSCDVPLIAGGPITPFLSPQEMQSLFNDDRFDYVVVGEGEDTLPRLIECLERDKRPERVGHVVYRANGIIRHSQDDVCTDLDILPVPDFSQFDLDRYLIPIRILPVMTSRGCPWGKCAFCTHHHIYQGKYRTLRIERFVESLHQLRGEYDCNHFTIQDEEMPSARAAKIANSILESGLDDISLYSYARLTEGYNDDRLLALLRKAGFCTLFWGLESGSQRVLDIMRKGTRVEVMGEILKKSSAHGISNLCFVMFGFPGETKADARETVRFLEQHADCIDDVAWSVFDLALNSPIGRNPQQWGMTIHDDGSYSLEDGMGHAEAILFSRRLAKETDVQIRRISSDKLLYLMTGYNRRMLRFLAASHRLLSRDEALERLEQGELNAVYPLVPGEIRPSEDGEGSVLFRPANVGETLFTNRCRPPRSVDLNALEVEMLRLADGTRSVESIVNTIGGRGRRAGPDEESLRRCRQFFIMVLSRGYGVAFAKPWRVRDAGARGV